jgi:hypothetical protein
VRRHGSEIPDISRVHNPCIKCPANYPWIAPALRESLDEPLYLAYDIHRIKNDGLGTGWGISYLDTGYRGR